ncbi:MAG TPA: SRPBCC family protein [Pyrinomonadaceae bacterium]|jgi:uncharacterized protein YndB with AHSA1/START domain|nr:SRPBCC family protein [Pyrinomonadaceae bacterium]
MNEDFFDIASDCEIVTTRVIETAREIAFRAWTDPVILQNWWGPAGFTNTFQEFNPVPGGKWRFVMHGPEKGNYPNECVFLRVEHPSLIVWDRISKPHFRVVTTFEEIAGGKTKLTFRMQFDNKKACDKIRPFAAEKNEENFDKLEVELAKM